MKTRSDWIFWLKWILANCLGETLGLGATFAIGMGIFSQAQEPQGLPALLGQGLAMTSSGLLEGIIVGMAQWRVLRLRLPQINVRTWTVATVIGAVLAWALGATTMVLGSLGAEGQAAAAVEPPQALVLLMAAGMGLAAGPILGFAQWVVLRRQVRRAGLWILANSLAWGLGMPLIFMAVDLAGRGSTLLGSVAIMTAAIALTGALVGAIHGLFLLKLTSSAAKRNLALNQS